MAVNASSTAAASASGVRAREWLRVTPANAVDCPVVSCIHPRWPGSLRICVVMCSTRSDDASASPMPANALNAPGPVDVMQTPTRSDVRA